MDVRMIIGLVIHGGIVWWLARSPDTQVITPFLAPFVLLNVIGMILVGIGKLRAGCITYMVGAVVFIPIGLIGVFGARAMLDKNRHRAFMEGV